MKHLFSAFAFLFGFVLLSAEYPLVSNGKSNAVIQQMPRPGASEFDAALELQTYLRKITGVDFRLTSGRPDRASSSPERSRSARSTALTPFWRNI